MANDSGNESACQAFRADYQAVVSEIGKAIVGQRPIIESVLNSLLAGGHVLLEGAPGLGKTALVRALAGSLHLQFSRIQFTPDLMPADILGTNIIAEDEHGRRRFSFTPGPIFGQIVLADEINRATPKTQSALLEAMQERQVTAGGSVRLLPTPFFVLATQNPLEHEGTYPLPESQLDRFLFKLLLECGDAKDLSEILDRTTTSQLQEIRPILDGAKILQHQDLVRRVVIAPHVQDYAIRCVLATQPKSPQASAIAKKYLRAGAGPRAAQAIVLAAKVMALVAGRFHAAAEDIRRCAIPAMRHRLILNFEAEAEGVSADSVLEQILESVGQ